MNKVSQHYFGKRREFYPLLEPVLCAILSIVAFLVFKIVQSINAYKYFNINISVAKWLISPNVRNVHKMYAQSQK